MGELNSEALSASARRARDLATLEGTTWDLLVIGGGITGAGVAQQAARRGWKVLLLEQRDFAWGTSSRSSKLVHGGLRYLKEGDIKTTLHSVQERQRLMQEAPELIEPQSFLFASCTGRKPGRWLFQVGLMVYDFMARHKNHFWAEVALTQKLAPGLAPPNLRGSLVFTDAKTDDARLVMRVLMEAQRDGATVLNYVSAQDLVMEGGRVAGIHAIDSIISTRFTVRAKSVVNATGVWADRLRAGVGGKPMLRPLRGSHVVVPFWRLPVSQSVSMMHPRDGRPVFLYPWEGATLIGTTDLDHQGDPNREASITQPEVDYLLEAVNDQFPSAALTEKDISACYAGVRPVVDDGTGDASKAARDHVVLDESGLISLAGGKLTTFRLMAQDALQLAAPAVGKPFSRDGEVMFTQGEPLNPRWSAAVRHRLKARYGYRAATLTRHATNQDLQTIPGTQTLWLELALAARHEAVMHLDDLLLRRTRLGILLANGAMEHLPRTRQLCAPHLPWNDAQWEKEIARYRSIIQAHYSLPASVNLHKASAP